MHLRILLLTLALLGMPLRGQDSKQGQSDQQVLDDFITTRGAGFGERPKEPKKTSTAANVTPAPKPTPAKQSSSSVALNRRRKSSSRTPVKGTSDRNPKVDETASTSPDVTSGTSAGAASGMGLTDGASSVPASATAPAIGLGYTILLASSGGSNTVVDSSREFIAGDKIRIALETNADGFLYIFNAENNQNPQMLFPHFELDGGENQITAHARDFFPADLRYSFEFDDKAATEHLYIIFSRTQLADIPTGPDLVKFCAAASVAGCYWSPTPEHWARILATAEGKAVESRNKDLARVQPAIPVGSRGIKVKREEPAPAVVRVKQGGVQNALLTKLELVHK